MNYVFFDTETTGMGAKDEVIQFSALVADESFKLKAYIDFYCYTTHKISQGAIDVHHITPEILIERSKFKTLEDQLFSNALLLSNNNVYIGFNSDFDVRMTNSTLRKYGAPAFPFGNKIPSLAYATPNSYFDVMAAYRRVKGLPYNYSQVKAIEAEYKDGINSASSLFKKQFGDKFSGDAMAHNSLFDSYLCYLLFRKIAPLL